MVSLYKFRGPILSFCMMAAIALFSLPSQAVEVQNVPNPRLSGGWVTDMSDILSPETEAEVNQMITALEAKNGTEIAVVTVPNTAPYGSPKEFTTALFNHWGVGKKGADNGVVFMISQGDRRVEIEIGYGVEGILPDAKVGNLINQKVTPRFKEGNFDQGVLDGTTALIFELSPETFPLQKFATRHQSWFYWLGGAGFFTGGFYKFFNRRRYLKPQGRSQCSLMSRPVYCKQCKKPMEKVIEEILLPQLTDVENFSKEHKYTEIVGYKCATCASSEQPNFHILFNIIQSNCLQCPECSGWTMLKKNEITVQPTYLSTGLRVISKTCEYCHHQETETIVLPIMVESSSSSDSGGGGGGSDFGGGDSGGGGAGGDW